MGNRLVVFIIESRGWTEIQKGRLLFSCWFSRPILRSFNPVPWGWVSRLRSVSFWPFLHRSIPESSVFVWILSTRAEVLVSHYRKASACGYRNGYVPGLCWSLCLCVSLVGHQRWTPWPRDEIGRDCPLPWTMHRPRAKMSGPHRIRRKVNYWVTFWVLAEGAFVSFTNSQSF